LQGAHITESFGGANELIVVNTVVHTTKSVVSGY